MTATDVRDVPLSKLTIAPENARFGRPVVGVETLAASIKAHGQLSPLGVYEQKGAFKVFAGARRLEALKLAGAASAQVKVRSREEARALSIAENDQREDMHPAEEAKAWAGMIGKGDDIKAIANAFGKSERFVLQRVKLAGLHPPIFEAFAKDEIDLELAEAYASAPVERQAALFKRYGKNGSAHSVRYGLNQGKLSSNDRLARFVGEAAYTAAGGQIEANLFPERDWNDDDVGDEPQDENFWLDRKLAEKLAAKKIDELSAREKAEGWGFVETGEQWPWDGSLIKGKASVARTERGKYGVFIQLTRDGGVNISRGVMRKGSSVARKPIGGKAKAKDIPDISAKGHEDATRIVSAALGRTLAQDPETALVALAACLVRQVFEWLPEVGDGWDDFDPYERDPAENVLSITTRSNVRGGNTSTSPPKMLTDAFWERMARHWFEALPKSWDVELERTLGAWPQSKLLELVAFCVGARVHMIEANPKTVNDEQHAIMGELARQSEFELAEHWTPDETWLARLSTAKLNDYAKSIGVTPGKNRKATAAMIADAAQKQGWIPPMVMAFLGAAPAKPEPKAQPKKPAAKKRAAAAARKPPCAKARRV